MPIVNKLKPGFLRQVATCMDKDPLDKENALALLEAVSEAVTGLCLEGTLELGLDDLIYDLRSAIQEEEAGQEVGVIARDQFDQIQEI